MRLERVELPLLDDSEVAVGALFISLLPNARKSNTDLLIDRRGHEAEDSSAAPVELVENSEYRYEIVSGVAGAIETDRPEVFVADDREGRTGRIKTGLATGTITVTLSTGGFPVGRASVEVRSIKLDYLSQYRWMLRDIADQAAELVMERFGPSEQQFRPDTSRDARTAYQRFCFLKSLLDDAGFIAAIQRVLQRPYVAWVQHEIFRSPSEGSHGGSWLARSVTRPGPKVRQQGIPGTDESPPIPLPKRIAMRRTEETLDNPPNRFVKFAITRWRDQIASLRDALVASSDSAPVRRGISETNQAIATLEDFLYNPIFHAVGRLEHFPPGNAVLIGRPGYRDIYRAFLQFELASQLSWDGGDSVYGAGQRNVAALYEFWVFLQLASVFQEVCGESADLSELIEVQEIGLGLALRRGKASALRGSVSHLGRQLRLELWFNRTFDFGDSSSASWTRQMRPDYSIFISPDSDRVEPAVGVWVHLDAKYRIDNLQEIFGADNGEAQRGEFATSASAKRDDLLKMHAYRDAIHRSAGAYVVYPGTDIEEFRKFHELLPGLGAFALRPAEGGEAEGSSALRRFLLDLIAHIASQYTQHERGRFWEREAFDTRPSRIIDAPAVPFLELPAADTRILLGFVKNRAHLDWVNRAELYNLRGDTRRGSVNLTSRELGAQLLLLYGPSEAGISLYHIIGDPILQTAAQLAELGYPQPRGSLYICLSIQRVSHTEWTARIPSDAVSRLLAVRGIAHGAPASLTWLDFVSELGIATH